MCLFELADLADELYERAINQVRNARIEILLVGAVDLGRNLQRQSATVSDRDRLLNALFAGDTTEKGGILTGPLAGSVQMHWQAVVNRCYPIGAGERPALRVGNRYQGLFAELLVQRGETCDVEPSMYCRQRVGTCEASSDRQMQRIGVKVDHVESLGPPAHVLQHERMQREGI